MNDRDRIEASLLGSCVGDALGAGVFKMSRQQIAERYPHGLTSYVRPPDDNYLAGMVAGEVTDGTSQLMLLSDVLSTYGAGDASARYAKALTEWMDASEFAKFVGPTTARAIRDGAPEPTDSADASNGAAMRITPVGWHILGDIDDVVRCAAGIAGLTHTGAGVIGACMVAAAVRSAVQGASVGSVVAAASDALDAAGEIGDAPMSARAMRLAFERAIEAGVGASKFSSLHQRLAAFDVPTGTAATGSVAAVFGILVATNGKAFDAITLAVNAGNDTHTTAMMTGAIVGAMNGVGDVPPALVRQLREVNERLHDLTFRVS